MFRRSNDAGPLDLVVIAKLALLEATRPALDQEFQSALKRFGIQSKP